MTLPREVSSGSLRVLHVISGINTGGAERFLSELAPQLRENGISQEIYSLSGEGSMSPVFYDRGFAVHKPNVGRSVFNAVKILSDLARLTDSYQPDIIQGWMYHGDLFSLLARHFSHQRKSKLIWNIRCSDLHLVDYSMQLRVVIRACTHYSHMPDLIIANSNAGAKSHLDLGYRPRGLAVIHNGVDTERYKPNPVIRNKLRRELGIDPKALLIIHAARVDPMKDHATLLRAVGDLKGTTIILVGQGTTSLDLPENAIALGNRSDVDEIFAAGDIIASSSSFGEGFSNALAEGMSTGLLPVATRVGDAALIVGNNGFLCEPGDINELRKAFERVRDMPLAKRQVLGVAARERITSNFSIRNAVDCYARTYRSICDSGFDYTRALHSASDLTVGYG